MVKIDPKRKIRTVLDISTKNKIISMIKTKQHKNVSIAELFNVHPSVITRIAKSEEILKEAIVKNPGSKYKILSKGRFNLVETGLLRYIELVKSYQIPVSGEFLKEKAREIADKLQIENFLASDGWFKNFKNRNNFTIKSVKGKEDCVDKKTVDQWRREDLQLILQTYPAQSIYNADETGLFFEMLSDKTISLRSDKSKFYSDSKNRVTLLLCTNMSGSMKLKPLIIGRSKKPRCFSLIKNLPVYYKANKSAWMTSIIFNEWLTLINEKQKKNNEKIALIIDNATCHTIINDLEFVDVFYLPKNSTSVLQPLDQGIIANFKSFYKKNLLRKIINKCDNKLTTRINMLEAFDAIVHAWDSVSAETIYNCFCHAFSVDRPNRIKTLYNEEIDCSKEIKEVNEIFNSNDQYTDILNVDDNLLCEQVDVDAIVEDLRGENNNDDRSITDNEEIIKKPILKEVGLALDTIKIFLMTTDNVTEDVFNGMKKVTAVYERESSKKMKQGTLDNYVCSNCL